MTATLTPKSDLQSYHYDRMELADLGQGLLVARVYGKETEAVALDREAGELMHHWLGMWLKRESPQQKNRYELGGQTRKSVFVSELRRRITEKSGIPYNSTSSRQGVWLAAQTGLSPETCKAYTHNRRSPTPTTAAQIGDALDWHVDAICELIVAAETAKLQYRYGVNA